MHLSSGHYSLVSTSGGKCIIVCTRTSYPNLVVFVLGTFLTRTVNTIIVKSNFLLFLMQISVLVNVTSNFRHKHMFCYFLVLHHPPQTTKQKMSYLCLNVSHTSFVILCACDYFFVSRQQKQQAGNKSNEYIK